MFQWHGYCILVGMKKLLFASLLAVLLTGCKKDDTVVPDQIEINMSAYVSRDGNNYSAGDSTRLRFVESKDTSVVIIAYTDNSGKAKVTLKKDTEYYFSVNSRTYNGPHYYYKKSEWLRSSWASDNGENYYQKGWPIYFYEGDWVNGNGSTYFSVADPSL